MYGCACATVELVRGRVGGVALATRTELDGIVVGDVSMSPQVEARALGILLRRAVLRHQRRQAVVAQIFHQHQALFDKVLNTNSIN